MFKEFKLSFKKSPNDDNDDMTIEDKKMIKCT